MTQTNHAIASRLNGLKGGRPRGAKSLIAHAMMQRVCLKNFRKHVKVLEDIIANPENQPQARISAIIVLWERGLGKVPQAVTGEGGGPVVLQLATGVKRSDGFGDWSEPKALEPPADGQI